MSRDTIRLPHDAYRLLQTLRAAGHSAYVVGGCVRDSLLGRLPGDWDICTSARPDEMNMRGIVSVYGQTESAPGSTMTACSDMA